MRRRHEGTVRPALSWLARTRTPLVAIVLSALSVTANFAAKKDVLVDPNPTPSGGSTAPAFLPGPQVWMEL